METRFSKYVLSFPGRLPHLINVYCGLELVGGSVRDIVSRPDLQAEAVLALGDRFRTPVLMTAMDLSAEAEAFGCEIRLSESEIPTVIGRKVTDASGVRLLPEPRPGDARTSVHLDAARRLAKEAGQAPVIGCMIGPFSLAARIFGVSEALMATALEPEVIIELLEKVTRFQAAYARAFRETGAAGVVVAEPAAGLLSPDGVARFSAPFVKAIAAESQTRDFSVILHNCGAKLVHLDAILESGVKVFHFGSPMDIIAALRRADGKFLLGGNLDPTAVFHNGSPESVRRQTRDLLEATRSFPSYFISSGCDIPRGTPLANIEAFYDVVAEFNALPTWSKIESQ
jgi:uroporphyrinogen decarboxylase